jgi:hypothetical protein
LGFWIENIPFGNPGPHGSTSLAPTQEKSTETIREADAIERAFFLSLSVLALTKLKVENKY